MEPEDEPQFETAKQRDAYYAAFNKKNMPVAKSTDDRVEDAEKQDQDKDRKRDSSKGKILDLHYKNDYSKKGKRKRGKQSGLHAPIAKLLIKC